MDYTQSIKKIIDFVEHGIILNDKFTEEDAMAWVLIREVIKRNLLTEKKEILNER